MPDPRQQPVDGDMRKPPARPDGELAGDDEDVREDRDNRNPGKAPLDFSENEGLAAGQSRQKGDAPDSTDAEQLQRAADIARRNSFL
jgi:hypothetical protein